MKQESKTIKIFGYGSLINELDLKLTVKNPRNIIPVKAFGFKRNFNLKSNSRKSKSGAGVCVLNVEKHNNFIINGICFDMDLKELKKLKKRESNYKLIEIEVCNYFDNSIFIKAYIWQAFDFEIFSYDFKLEENLHYLDICFKGCKKFGEAFLKDFKESTYIDNKTLLDLENELKL